MTDLYQEPREQKYVVLETGEFIIIAPTLSHCDVVSSSNPKPVSAGFCRIYFEDNKFNVTCYGKSQTLKLDSRIQVDTDILSCGIQEEVRYTLFHGDKLVLHSKTLAQVNDYTTPTGNCEILLNQETLRLTPKNELDENTWVIEHTLNEARW